MSERPVWWAPPGTDPTDRSAWTQIGYTDPGTLQVADDDADKQPWGSVLPPRSTTVRISGTLDPGALASLVAAYDSVVAWQRAVETELTRLILAGRGPARPELEWPHRLLRARSTARTSTARSRLAHLLRPRAQPEPVTTH